MIVVVGGVQGTGKSTLAAAIGERLGATVLSRDLLEAALWRSGVGAEDGSRRAADAQLESRTADGVGQGRHVVVDSVFGSAAQRARFTRLAATLGADLRWIRCVCSDEATHRARIAGRDRGIDGWYELTWDDVESTRARWEPWDEPCLVVDAMRPLAELLDDALAYLGS